MERRTFLRMMTVGTGVGLTSALLPNSQVEAARVQNMVSASWGSLLISGLAWFAENVAAPLIVNVATDWLTSKSDESDGQAGNHAVSELDTKGYTPYQYSPVYQTQPPAESQISQTPFFGCTGGGNTFVPVIYPNGYNGYDFTYFGGAAILGLQDYTYTVAKANDGSFNIADYFVPAGKVITCDCMFSPNKRWTAWYPTNGGTVNLQYSPPYQMWSSLFRKYIPYNGKISMSTKYRYSNQDIFYPYTRTIGFNEVFA